MNERTQFTYRRGRLQLPSDISEWAAADVASWLAGLPESDRVRAFRALPFNRGAGAFLVMSAVDRAALLLSLNPENRRGLLQLSRPGLLAETLLHLESVSRETVLGELPPSKRESVEAEVALRMVPPASVAAKPERRPTWRSSLARAIRRRKPRDRDPAA